MSKLALMWHPDSPGMKVPVCRTWLGRLLKPRDFATLGETLAFHRARRLVEFARDAAPTSPTPEADHG